MYMQNEFLKYQSIVTVMQSECNAPLGKVPDVFPVLVIQSEKSTCIPENRRHNDVIFVKFWWSVLIGHQIRKVFGRFSEIIRRPFVHVIAISFLRVLYVTRCLITNNSCNETVFAFVRIPCEYFHVFSPGTYYVVSLEKYLSKLLLHDTLELERNLK